MERAKVFRGLRIAWTAFLEVLCVLLIVLWVRSYWWVDIVGAGKPNSPIGVAILSGGGQLAFVSTTYLSEIPGLNEWVVSIEPADENLPTPKSFGFGYFYERNNVGLVVPHWFATFTTIALALAPWVRWSNQFSLRTLLIATTIVALLLGLVVYMAR